MSCFSYKNIYGPGVSYKGKKTMSKFEHSVRVPRLYKVAATMAKQCSEGVAGIKQLVYGGKMKHRVSILLTIIRKI